MTASGRAGGRAGPRRPGARHETIAATVPAAAGDGAERVGVAEPI
ncbi:hypothetical protein Gocc_2421 [Gaiella occulta]|uniref:Uncharacterized protein n=1 Tax=Gaiella occulta TaxID=1002870 RepID=A0A7M2YWL1_9ACTN|nr:hypothetical protein [Gaiella occulta]RDI73857.1 hypothetical protein Gocc_2421 [Gaiella occulta]